MSHGFENPLPFLNIIIRTKNVRLEDRTDLFPDDEIVWVFDPQEKDMFDFLLMLGLFKSRGQARKNWKNTGAEIPRGWTEFNGLGKFRKSLCIWHPRGIFSCKSRPNRIGRHKEWRK